MHRTSPMKLSGGAVLLAMAAALVSRPYAHGDFDESRLAQIAPVVEAAIKEKKLPGAVVLVGRGTETAYRQAFGNRALVPARESMTVDTVFDIASLTKVVATTTAVMVLVEEGRIGLDEPVAAYIPEFAKYGKQRITIRHLLTHVSGLRADLDLALEFQGAAEAIRLACEEVPEAAPGEKLVYSDINFFLLGEIVQRASGLPLDRFAAERIFGPLEMHDTRYMPPASLRPRIAPTEACLPLAWPCGTPGAPMLRGVVHDPTARRMGGVAGHAGVFSTADDLARFCRMLIGGGTLGSVRLLSAVSVALMTRPATPPDLAQIRGLGWDIDSRFSLNRGDLFPPGTFGHTGWTGTSMWVDPINRTYLVFLSNRVHPDGKGDVGALRARVASIVASAMENPIVPEGRLIGRDFGPRPAPSLPRPPREPVLAGIDVLRAEGFARLRGRRVGLVTNHTGRARDGATTIDLLREAPGVSLVSLFSPEHGIRGIVDADVPSTRDERTGLPIHSLYGETRRPTPAMLEGLDTIVIDLQDVGARFYTYMTTMGYVLEEASQRHIRVVVLDRPNPVNGFSIEGPVQEQAAFGFTAYFPMPVRHGMTLGELARVFNGENHIGADLDVVAMQHWSRDAWFDHTGLEWVSPSPNMRNLNEATLYPGVGAIEYSNLSVGRGTDTPFEQLGAPWIDGTKLAETLNARNLPGIRFYPVSFTPASGKYAGEPCRGVFLVITDREALRPLRLGIEIAAALFRLHPDRFDPGETWRLIGSKRALESLKAGTSPSEVASGWAADEARWRTRRAQYLLYY
jgi:uncharacterized protein YbbC (DUF1343 family)/CubicO group peptidase (beta-lactamase class C family)